MNVGETAANSGDANTPTGPTEGNAVWPFPAESDEEREQRINADGSKLETTPAVKFGDDEADELHRTLGFPILDANGNKLKFGDMVKCVNRGDVSGYIINICVLDTGMARLVIADKENNLTAVDACMTETAGVLHRPPKTVTGVMEKPLFEFGDVIQDQHSKVKGTIVEMTWPESGCITYVCRRKIGKKERKKGERINADVFIAQRHAILVEKFDVALLPGPKEKMETKIDAKSAELKPAKVPGPPPVRYKAEVPQAQFGGRHPFNHY